MLVSLHGVLRLPVYTRSGKKLGHVHDVNLQLENHAVREYVVRESYFNREEYLIRPVQVVDITPKKMIVDDDVMKVKEASKGAIPTTPAGAIGDIVSIDNKE